MRDQERLYNYADDYTIFIRVLIQGAAMRSEVYQEICFCRFLAEETEMRLPLRFQKFYKE